MDTMEIITKALEAVVEQKVAEKATTVNLDSVLEFIRNSTEDDRKEIMQCLDDFHQDTLESYYQDRFNEDESIVRKEDIDVDVVKECGLMEDCFNEYLDDCYDLREVAKDIIDRI